MMNNQYKQPFVEKLSNDNMSTSIVMGKDIRQSFWLKCLMVFFAGLMMFSNAYAQLTITGKVSDKDGQPLPGATVRIQNTNNGTVTDDSGAYKIEAQEGAVVLFEFSGYITSTITIGAQTQIDVTLQEDVQEEVVIVGYGELDKKAVTGNITSIKGSEIMQTTVPSFEAALQGKAAGVQVIQGSGMAGSASVIRIRGNASISAGSDPLYVVDGIPITQDYFLNGNRGAMNTNPLASLNPNDIESIDILKDASAAAIYGSRGANGVILITTKRGKKGKPVFEVGVKVGTSTPTQKVDMLNSSEFLQLFQEAYENDGGVGQAPLPYGRSWNDARNTNTDWWNLTTRAGLKQDYNFSVRQGGDKHNIYAGLSYSDNESYLVGNTYQRLSGRINADYVILGDMKKPMLKLGLSTSFSHGINRQVNGAWSGGIGNAMSQSLPIISPYNADGSFNRNQGPNPLLNQELFVWRNRENRSINSLAIDFTPIDNLVIRATGSMDYSDTQNDQYSPATLQNTTSILGTAYRFPSWVTNFNVNLTASYKYAINEKHKLDFLVGMEYQKSITNSYNRWEVSDIDGPLFKKTTTGANLQTFYQANADQVWSFMSYFGRVNYAYANKLFVNASLRVDASSRFGSNYRYGYFPSVGVGYLLSEEDFMKNLLGTTVSTIKLKVSYGLTGNANIENYARFGTFTPAGSQNPYNGQPTTYPIRLENPDLRWEVQQTIDGGIELGFLKDRITAELSFFRKTNSDVILSRRVQFSSGFGEYLQNLAEIRNQGIELAITSRNFVSKDNKGFSWTTEFNVSRFENKVISLGPTDPDQIQGGTNDTRVQEGQPVGINYLVRFSRVDSQTGLPVWLDKDGNETFNFSLNNRVFVGSVVPDAIGGITNTFRYKGFDLSVLVAFTIGGTIWDNSAKRQLGSGLMEQGSPWNMRREMLNRWTKPGDNAQYPRLTRNVSTYPGLPGFWDYNSTMFLYDATFARVRNLAFGYTFDGDAVKKFGLSSMRVYFVGTNLFTFTRYPGADPEITRDFENAQDRNMSPNVTYLTAPPERTFSLGVNIQF
jgi:TonB-dependent starch-binding outer membrane protein SusC